MVFALAGMLDLTMLALKVLAVVGGIAVGALGTGWLVKWLVRSVAFRDLSPSLTRYARVLGGLVLGGLVVVFVFKEGGLGGMGGSGGGWWPFGQSGAGTSTSAGSSTEKSDVDVKPLPPAPPDTLRIQMRGGKEAEDDQRFYQIDGDPPRTWSELEKVLAERRKKSSLKVIEIIIGKGSVDEQSDAVHELKNWAKKNDVAVK